jgi:hypothetical protein
MAQSARMTRVLVWHCLNCFVVTAKLTHYSALHPVRYFTICINKASAIYEPDGSVRVTVAHRDPGTPNWINTCGHNEGTMLWRWYRLAAGSEAVEPSCGIIKTTTAL